jgi:hypothetical protein
MPLRRFSRRGVGPNLWIKYLRDEAGIEWAKPPDFDSRHC